MQEDHCEFQARLGNIVRPSLKTKIKPSLQMEKQIQKWEVAYSERGSAPCTGVEGGCPGSDLGVFGQHVTDVMADSIVDGIVVGAGSSVALQPTSGQGPYLQLSCPSSS